MIHLRSLTEADIPFIYNSWLKSCRKSYSDLSNSEYFQMKKHECAEILKNSQVLIACDKEDSNFILGYLVYNVILDEVCILHYAYVKAPNRKCGILKKLIFHVYPNLEANPIFITHQNYLIEKIKDKFGFVYKPEYRSK